MSFPFVCLPTAGTRGCVQRGTYLCGGSVEGMSRMSVIFRPASFSTEKIETKELLSLWEEGLSRGILQKGPRNLNSGNEIYVSVHVSNANSLGAGFL